MPGKYFMNLRTVLAGWVVMMGVTAGAVAGGFHGDDFNGSELSSNWIMLGDYWQVLNGRTEYRVRAGDILSPAMQIVYGDSLDDHINQYLIGLKPPMVNYPGPRHPDDYVNIMFEDTHVGGMALSDLVTPQYRSDRTIAYWKEHNRHY